MRVTRESLLRIAKETAQERAFNDPDIVAAYLTGSLLNVDPMLGGSTDIDIVFVHKTPPAKTREFFKLTADFHIDVRRRLKDEFKSPRELRGDPWMGYEMYDPILLYEREKFFDFVQASLRAGFDFEGPPLMLQRCRKLLSQARRTWIELSEGSLAEGPAEVRTFMDSLFLAVNTVAELSGPPIYERRLLLEFPARAEASGHPGLAAGAYGLVGAGQVNADRLKSWLSDWKAAFVAAAEKPGVHEHIHAVRINYYEKAIKELIESEDPAAAIWPLIHTWTLAVENLNEDHLKFWQAAVNSLGLHGIAFEERVQGLDQYIDGIEIILDELARASGLETS
jgi:hypothetical protein